MKRKNCMKRKYMFMALLCYALTTAAQDASHNYVRTRSMLDETGGKYLDKVEYYDGLGRPFQTVEGDGKQQQSGDAAGVRRCRTCREFLAADSLVCRVCGACCIQEQCARQLWQRLASLRPAGVRGFSAEPYRQGIRTGSRMAWRAFRQYGLSGQQYG